MSNVTQFPGKPDQIETIKGPARYGHKIVIDGHEVPNMWIVDKGDIVDICFPGPVHFEFPRDIAAHACALAAKAMAIGAGHSHVSSTHAMTKSYGPQVMELKP